MSRTSLRPSFDRAVALSTSLVILATGCGRTDPPAAIPASRDAGSWGTLVLASADQIRVPPPPERGSAAERSDLQGLQNAERRQAGRQSGPNWSARPPVAPWMTAAMRSAAQHRLSPPRASRAFGLLSIAMYDAVVSAWHWKYVYERDPPTQSDSAAGPDPSYPSEHAAIAGAASGVLASLFPDERFDEAGRDAAASRVAARDNYPSDVEAGLELGRSVAQEVLSRAAADADAQWDGKRPTGPVFWEPPPGTSHEASQPVEPAAGHWHTWVVSPSEVRTQPPPRLDSPEFRIEANQLIGLTKSLTDEQQRMVRFWSAKEGTAGAAGIWNRIALRELTKERQITTPESARVLALLNLAQSDAGVAAWNAKYTYWSPRPGSVLTYPGLAPGWKPFLATPRSPSFISAHAAYSGAAASVLSALFPTQKRKLSGLAQQAVDSRLYGGVSFPSDTSEGLRVGRRVGRLVLSHAEKTKIVFKP